LLPSLSDALPGRLAGSILRGVDGNITFQMNFEEACAWAFVLVRLYFLLDGIVPLIRSFFDLLPRDAPHVLNDRFGMTLVHDAERWGHPVHSWMGVYLGRAEMGPKDCRTPYELIASRMQNALFFLRHC
jgi:hypothetical protein